MCVCIVCVMCACVRACVCVHACVCMYGCGSGGSRGLNMVGNHIMPPWAMKKKEEVNSKHFNKFYELIAIALLIDIYHF